MAPPPPVNSSTSQPGGTQTAAPNPSSPRLLTSRRRDIQDRQTKTFTKQTSWHGPDVQTPSPRIPGADGTQRETLPMSPRRIRTGPCPDRSSNDAPGRELRRDQKERLSRQTRVGLAPLSQQPRTASSPAGSLHRAPCAAPPVGLKHPCGWIFSVSAKRLFLRPHPWRAGHQRF